MIRDTFTATLVTLTLLGTAPMQDGETLGLKLLAATGDVRRTLIQFLDLHGAQKAGTARDICAPGAFSGAACLGDVA